MSYLSKLNQRKQARRASRNTAKAMGATQVIDYARVGLVEVAQAQAIVTDDGEMFLAWRVEQRLNGVEFKGVGLNGCWQAELNQAPKLFSRPAAAVYAVEVWRYADFVQVYAAQ